MKHLKLVALGAAAAAGIASAAFAQQPATGQQPGNRPTTHQKMNQSGSMGMMGMMGMMNDPEMRKQMTDMMRNCNQMMSRMDGMSAQHSKSS